MAASSRYFEVETEDSAATLTLDIRGLAGGSERLARQIDRITRQVLGAVRSPMAIDEHIEGVSVQTHVEIADKQTRKRYEAVIEKLDTRLAALLEGTFDPPTVEEYLGITRAERKRWEADGRLPVLGYQRVRIPRAGEVEAPYYDAVTIRALRPDTIEGWRERDRDATREKRRAGARKGAETRKRLQQERRAEYEALEEACQAVARELGNPSMALIAEAFFFAQLASRYAKTRRGNRDPAGERGWYMLKDRALMALIRSGKLPVTFLPGEDKLLVEACEMHFDMYREERGYNRDLPFMVWAEGHRKMLRRCPDCDVSLIRDYYSLYTIRLETTALNGCLHLPYPLGRKRGLPEKRELPRDQSGRRQSYDFFGGVIHPEDAELYPERHVRKRLTALCERLERVTEAA